MPNEPSIGPDVSPPRGLRGLMDVVARWIVAVSALAIIGLICGQVIVRYVFDYHVLGLDELSVITVLWLWFFGAVLAANSGFFITGGFPVTTPRLKRVIAIASSVFGLIVTAVFGYMLYEYCAWTVARDARSVALSIPVIYGVSGPLVALGLIAVISVSDLIAGLTGWEADAS